MAITYASGAGTIITSFLVSTTCGTQGGGLAANEVDIPNATPSSNTGYGGNVGSGTKGVGDTFVGRRIVFDIAGTPEERIIVSIAGTTLTLHEDLTTAPVSATTFDLYYELADIEDGGAGGGIALSTRSGFWEFSRKLTIGNGTDPAGLAAHGGQAMELPDVGTGDALLVTNNGYFRLGYYSGGLPINGGVIAHTSKSNDELGFTANSGADVQFIY